MELPEAAAAKLIHDWQHNPAAVREYFSAGGFEIEGIMQRNCQLRCIECGQFWNDEPTVQTCGDPNCGGTCIPVK